MSDQIEFGYEYFDEDNARLRDPNTYLNKTPLDMVRHFARTYKQSLDLPWMKDTDKDLLRLVLVKEE